MTDYDPLHSMPARERELRKKLSDATLEFVVQIMKMAAAASVSTIQP